MKFTQGCAALFLLSFTVGCTGVMKNKKAAAVSPKVRPTAPMAAVIPSVTTLHGEKRVDNYAWLRNKENPDTIAYLEAENTYTQERMRHTKGLQQKLYEEMLQRIVEDDNSVPARKGDYFYYTRTQAGKPYKLYCRKKGSLDAPEEVLLDVNDLAEGKDYTSVGVFSVSPNHNLLAFSVDDSGDERHTLRFKDLQSGKLFPDKIDNTYYTFAWGNDNATVFYTTIDHANRPHRLIRHTVGTPSSTDTIVHQEDDERFFVEVERTRSGDYILLSLLSAVTSEVRYLDANTPQKPLQVLQPRQQGVEYRVDHHSNRFFILTNEDAINFKLMQAPVTTPGKAHWTTVIPHHDETTLSRVLAFKNHIVLYERGQGLPQLRVITLANNRSHYITFSEPTYEVWPGANLEFNTPTLRFGYTSMITPESTFDYRMSAKTRTLLKEEPVRGYERSRYVTERIFSTSPDGTRVPISLVYRKTTRRKGKAPLLLYGYGAYGVPYDAYFKSQWFSLLDRGMVVAIAHVRGGGEFGRRWKLDGMLTHKSNTFTDFIAAAEHLIAQKYTRSDRLVIEGRSAGGLLMGAVLNLRPDLFKAAVAGVPFVDVVNTMLDATIPLTVTEWEEWGNPNRPADFKTIAAYSPYDNVEAKDYPGLLVVAGLNDSRVHYWEPAKWTAKLRAHKTDDNPLLLKTHMGAGHGGASGRYGHLKDLAFEYAFMLDQVGLKN